MRVLAIALILTFGALAHANDPPAAARASAALALAKAKSVPGVVATAPAPRPAVLDYETAKRLSIERAVPVVVFVGCAPVRVSETLTVSVESMTGYAPGTVLICYPSHGDLWADAKLACPATGEDIAKAAKVAGKKIEVKPVGKRLDWS